MTSGCTIKRRVRKNPVQPDLALDGNIAARAAALRAGQPMPELSGRFAPGPESSPADRPGPHDMTRDEICNVAPLSKAEHTELFRNLESFRSAPNRVSSGAEFTLYDWPESDVRWTLTPHQLGKLERRKRSAT